MATQEEMLRVMAILSAGVGVPVAEYQTEVYSDLLGDLRYDVLKAAARQALLEHEYRTIPAVGTIRRIADEIMHGSQVSADEAWAAARSVSVAWSDAHYPGMQLNREPFDKKRAALGPHALAVAESIGWSEIRSGDQSVVRAHFIRLYNERVTAIVRERRMPAALRDEIKHLASGIGRIE